jgi:hypothetical protein
MKLVLIGHCSARKSEQAPESLRAANLRAGAVTDLARTWRRRVARSGNRVPARDLYVGPGVRLIGEAAQEARAQWYIVSAGHGLVSAHTKIPPYDLSVGTDRSSVMRKLHAPKRATAYTWWSELTSHPKSKPIKRLIERRNDALVIVALSSRYLRMVAPELVALESAALRRLRIVGPASAAIPTRLRAVMMPYDARLNSQGSGMRGGQATFTQRAALHFLHLIVQDRRRRSVESHATLVQRALRRLRAPKPALRRRVSDGEIRSIIKRYLLKAKQGYRAALRALRDQHGVSCEQSRFRRLWEQVAA